MTILPRLSLFAACLLLASLALAEAPITQIVIETEPKDAEVLVDGALKSKDAATVVVIVSAGKHAVEIRKPGMQSESRSIEIGEGVTQKLDKIVLRPEPLPDFAKLLNPVKDAFETPEQFAVRVQKEVAEFNRHSQEGDPNYRVGWLTLDKDFYRIETGYFGGSVAWSDPVRDWGTSRFQQASLIIPKEQIKAFWNTGAPIPSEQADQAKKEEIRFPLFVNLKWQGERMELERILVKGLEKQWLAKAEQNQNFRDCPECPEMVKIPSLGIAIGKYEVTQAQWKAIIGSNPSKYSACGGDCPVEQVSWNDIQDFIGKLNHRTGKTYRLPTEKEWEAACRAGGQDQYCGSNDIEAVAWYFRNSEYKTHPVGKKNPNGFGLHDMSGNVWEWTSSCWENKCEDHVVRGSSCWLSDNYLHRGNGGKGGGEVLGFRLARD